MWTDGRYFIQIEKELYPGWKMQKMGIDDSLSVFISNNLPKGITIGMDYSNFTVNSAKKIMNALKEYNFIDDKNNIIDDIWGTLRPKYHENKVLILPDLCITIRTFCNSSISTINYFYCIFSYICR